VHPKKLTYLKLCGLVSFGHWIDPFFVFSVNARARVRQRDGHHTAYVRTTCHLPVQDAGPEGLLSYAAHSTSAEAAHAGVLPDDLVPQQRDRSTGGL